MRGDSSQRSRRGQRQDLQAGGSDRGQQERQVEQAGIAAPGDARPDERREGSARTTMGMRAQR